MIFTERSSSRAAFGIHRRPPAGRTPRAGRLDSARLSATQGLLEQFAGLLVFGGVGRIHDLLDAISGQLPVARQGEKQVDRDGPGGADFGHQGMLKERRIPSGDLDQPIAAPLADSLGLCVGALLSRSNAGSLTRTPIRFVRFVAFRLMAPHLDKTLRKKLFSLRYRVSGGCYRVVALATLCAVAPCRAAR